MLGLLLTALPAQNPLPVAMSKVEEAKAYTSTKQYDLAAASYKEAIAQYRQLDDLTTWLETQRAMAKLLGDTMAQPIKGIEYLEQEAFPKMKTWRLPDSEAECKQYCLLLLRKAKYEKTLFDFDALKVDLQKAMPYLDGRLAKDDDDIADIAEYVFRELGNAYVRLGEYEGAKNVFQRALEYAIAHQAPNVASFIDHGSLYMTSLEAYPEALEIFEKGLRFDGISDVDKVMLYSNKAECLAHMNRYPDALAANEIASRLMSDIDTSEERYKRCQYGIFENFGIIQLGMALAGGDTALFAKSKSGYRAAIEVANSDKPVPKRDIAGFHISLGEVFEHQKNYAEACKLYHEAIRILIPDFQGDMYQNPPAEMLGAENFLIKALERKATCFLALDQPEKALECYERIPFVDAQLIATHAYESSSLRTVENARVRFDQAIEIAWQLYQQTHRQGFAERAFALTEQARAVLLLQSIAKARLDFQLPPDIRKQEHELDIKLAWYEQKIATEEQAGEDPNSRKMKQLKKDQFQLKQDQLQLQDQLRRDYSDYASLSDQFHFMNANGVAKLLRKGQAMIDYYLTDSAAYVFYFNKAGDFSARKEVLPPLFRENVLRYFTFMNAYNEKQEDKEWYLGMSFELYKFLLQPELNADKNTPESLLIIPDDALAFIPFEVLQSEQADKNAAWPDMKYLMDTISTAYAYSATLWDMQQKISEDHRSKPAPAHNFAGFAPSYGSNAPQGATRSVVHIPDALIYDIKSTKIELDSVHGIMGGLAFYDSLATEQQFKEIAPNCSILLLAMHGLANDEHPELSCLLFGRPKGDSINNNVLFANELQIMRLQADLAVLSACHTGFGKLHKGEGVYSLARAFAVAGVPSTVMSIWRLHESTAPLLMEAFFKHLKSGKTKDEALRLAKREFLKNDANIDITHPFYWAGVTVSGDMCSLGPSSSFSSLWWWIGAGVLVLVLVLVFRKGKREKL